MVAYFVAGVVAARMNRRAEGQQAAVGLDNLSTNAAAAAAAGRVVPQNGPRAPAPVASTTHAGVSRRQGSGYALGREAVEWRDGSVNPFNDPRNVVA
jgi:hypothetical protein